MLKGDTPKIVVVIFIKIELSVWLFAQNVNKMTFHPWET